MTARNWGPYLYALPALVLVSGVVHYGIAANAMYSTWDWNGVSPRHTGVGAGNYLALATDPVFWTAARNTLLFAVATVGIQMVLGFLLAVLVRTRTSGGGILRTLIFVPVVISPAIVATSFRLLLSPDGEVNQLLALDHAWLADPRTALMTIIAINIWQYTGYSFVIYDAAISQIDPSVIEAARLDGAGTAQLLRRVVAPLVSGSHLVLVVLGVISALKTFDIVFLTTGGGPGVETEFLSTYIYKQVINQFHAGYGAALSMVLVLVALLFAVLQVRLAQRAVS
ncbi:sugar ABC transporter permease [Nonomuraea sp. B10E15]|uniref:carbohydrate ABC transporter permease n=1 Tax=unclassified Nonomuraea TaxID=2593643 RepID=UPI00325DCA94